MNKEYSSTLFKEIFNKFPNQAVVVNEDFKVTTTTENFDQTYNYFSKDKIIFLDLIAPSTKKEVRNALILIIENKKDNILLSDINIKRKTDDRIAVDLELKLLNKTGEVLIIIYENKSKESDELYQKYKTIFNNTNDALFLIDVTIDNKLVYDLLNPTHEKLTGLKTKQVKGKNPRELLGEEMGAQVENNYIRCLKQKEVISYEEKLDLPNGTRYWLTKLSPVIVDGQVTQIIGSAKDITERKKQNEKIEYISFHDQLTGLYNRRFYDEKIKEIEEKRKFPVSIIVGDANGLKITNDVFGHEAGDELLKSTAKILKECTRQKDYIVRWGGDEFCIIAPETNEKEGQEIINRIHHKMEEYDFENIPISVAFGLATKRNTEQSLNVVFNEAEDKMYRNKEEEKQKFNNRLLQAMLNKLEDSNYYVVDHSQRMIELTKDFAEKFDLSEEKKDRLIKAVKVHDIGKLALDQKMLKKDKKFSDEELNKFKKHPEYSYKIINNFKSFHRITSDIIHHHELWNGSGYPDGLAGENIPWLARIIAVVDTFDALTFKGINHELALDEFNTSMSDEAALERIKEYSGVYFDPKVVNMFEKVVST